MDIAEWLRDGIYSYQQDGVRGAFDSLYPAYYKLHQFIPDSDGTNIYDRDWDALIVIDACRLDLFQEVSKGYSALSTVESITSVNSQTPRWMEQTFTADRRNKTKDTVYVCGSPFSEKCLDPNWFQELNEVWKMAWDSPGTVPPRAVTDTAIQKYRQENPDRMIIHYLQPHCPFIPAPELSAVKTRETFDSADGEDVWVRLRRSKLSEADVWNGYKENLRVVLDDIQLLRENIDAAQLVLTSDHGNGIGEWGIYGHPPNMWQDCVREVPWVELSAIDSGEYVPDNEYQGTDQSTQEQLQSLGYI